MACLEGPHREVKAKVQSETVAGTRAHVFIKLYGWSAMEFSV